MSMKRVVDKSGPRWPRRVPTRSGPARVTGPAPPTPWALTPSRAASRAPWPDPPCSRRSASRTAWPRPCGGLIWAAESGMARGGGAARGNARPLFARCAADPRPAPPLRRAPEHRVPRRRLVAVRLCVKPDVEPRVKRGPRVAVGPRRRLDRAGAQAVAESLVRGPHVRPGVPANLARGGKRAAALGPRSFPEGAQRAAARPWRCRAGAGTRGGGRLRAARAGASCSRRRRTCSIFARAASGPSSRASPLKACAGGGTRRCQGERPAARCAAPPSGRPHSWRGARGFRSGAPAPAPAPRAPPQYRWG
jgi:hypothetical protein